MKVKYIGFGGGYIEYPCYEDENGKFILARIKERLKR